MALSLFLGGCFVGLFIWIITWFVTRWAASEASRQQAERARQDRFRQMSPEAPRAAGLRSDVRRLG